MAALANVFRVDGTATVPELPATGDPRYTVSDRSGQQTVEPLALRTGHQDVDVVVPPQYVVVSYAADQRSRVDHVGETGSAETRIKCR